MQETVHQRTAGEPARPARRRRAALKTAAPLSAEEVELARRFAAVLDRSFDGDNSQPVNDPAGGTPPPRSDAKPAAPDIIDTARHEANALARIRATPWLKHTRRRRLRSIAANGLPWIVTAAVIMTTVTAVFAVLVGPPKCMELLENASGWLQMLASRFKLN